MLEKPLTQEELCSIIEGKGAADRIPLFVHFWTHVNAFPQGTSEQVAALLSQYPQDAQVIGLNIPSVYDAPADDKSYRWSYMDQKNGNASFDSNGFIEDWDTQLEPFLRDFPSPEYKNLIQNNPTKDGRYRLGCWWFFYFERFWSVRGMENALVDFYENPEAIHAFFRKLTDFYLRMVERAKYELDLDGIFTSDDLGTQVGPFFSKEIFDTFFAPYYKEVIDKVHSLGMHFWLHACGNIEPFLSRFIDLGIDVLHPIQKYTMDEAYIAQKYGDKITIWAGFDVQQIIPYGTPEQVREEVRYLIDTYARKDGRFMFTLGNGTTGDTPYESLVALFDETMHYGKEKLKRLKQA